jgi:hypothetical protein
MNLNLDAKKQTWPKTYYLFIEKTGPFMETAPKAWQEFRSIIDPIVPKLKMKSFASLYKIHPEMIYRAGIMLNEKPAFDITGLQSEEFQGGDYLNYIFKGSYKEIPDACGKVYEDLHVKRIESSLNWAIENYMTNPETTAENENIVEILIPIS